MNSCQDTPGYWCMVLYYRLVLRVNAAAAETPLVGLHSGQKKDGSNPALISGIYINCAVHSGI